MTLTGKEQIVAKMIAEGYTNFEIAKNFGIKERTAKQYCQNIYRKFEISGGITRVKFARAFTKVEPTPLKKPLPLRLEKVVYWIAQGYKNSEIAKRIGRTENIVKNSTRDALNFTGMNNRIELTHWYNSKYPLGGGYNVYS